MTVITLTILKKGNNYFETITLLIKLILRVFLLGGSGWLWDLLIFKQEKVKPF